MKTLLLLSYCLGCSLWLHAQSPDSRITLTQQPLNRKVIPSQATIRSLILPGLGQIYNRHFWKVPVIYGGLGVGIYFLVWNQDRYNAYLSGYEQAFNATAVNPAYGVKTSTVRGQVLTIPQLKRGTDLYRTAGAFAVSYKIRQ